MNRKRSSLGHEGGDVLKLGVRFCSGKWQSEWPRGLRFGFRFRFGLLRGLMLCWFRVRAIVLAFVGCFGYALGWYLVLSKGVGLRGKCENGSGCLCYIYIRITRVKKLICSNLNYLRPSLVIVSKHFTPSKNG